MDKKLINAFTNLAGAFLLAASWLMFLGNMGSPNLAIPQDPVFEISMRYVCWGAGFGAGAVAFICLFGRNTRWKLIILFWTGVNLLIYQWGVYHQTHRFSLDGYLGNLENSFHLPSPAMDRVVKIAMGCLIAGSSILMAWQWAMARNTRTISCANCGGHVQFAIQAIGNKIPCPHCQKLMTLPQTENLKISCYFCHGHIEFPAHAIGEKMPCPHCKMDITLKEPA